MSNNHPGRRESAPRPDGQMLRDAREYVGHTQQQAANTVYRSRLGWQKMERGGPTGRPTDPAVLELYLLKTGQIEAGETWVDWVTPQENG